MARPKKLDTPTKEHFVGFWLSEELYQVVLTEAKKAGLSQSAYWRSLAVNQEVRQRPVLIHNVDAIVSELRQINKLGSIVTSNASARLARVRQYVYYMDQLNSFSISLAGGESGRLVKSEYFTTLYEDLDNMETLIQLSTTSTLDARTLLQNHLTELQNALPR